MNRKITGVLMSLVMATAVMPIPAMAAQQSAPNSVGSGGIITPFWTNTALARANISVSGSTVKPSAYIVAQKTTTEIEGTLYLEEKSGGSWEEVASWDISGTGYLNAAKSYRGSSGTTYRARAEVSVGGEYVECVSASCEA